jgi:hypothetical protein
MSPDIAAPLKRQLILSFYSKSFLHGSKGSSADGPKYSSRLASTNRLEAELVSGGVEDLGDVRCRVWIRWAFAFGPGRGSFSRITKRSRSSEAKMRPKKPRPIDQSTRLSQCKCSGVDHSPPDRSNTQALELYQRSQP